LEKATERIFKNRFLKHDKFVPPTTTFTPELLELADTFEIHLESSSTLNLPNNDNNTNITSDSVICEDVEQNLMIVEETKKSLFSANNTYPDKFPFIQNNINGHYLTNASFMTIQPYQSVTEYLCDDVINTFFQCMQYEAEQQKFDLLIFDTMFCESILRRSTISCGFKMFHNV